MKLRLLLIIIVAANSCTTDSHPLVSEKEVNYSCAPYREDCTLSFRASNLPAPPRPIYREGCRITTSGHAAYIANGSTAIGSAVYSYPFPHPDQVETLPTLGIVHTTPGCGILGSFILAYIDLTQVGDIQISQATSSVCDPNRPAIGTTPERLTMTFETLDWDIGLSRYLPDTTTGYAPAVIVDRVLADSSVEGRFVGRFIKDDICRDYEFDPDTLVIEEGWFRAAKF